MEEDKFEEFLNQNPRIRELAEASQAELHPDLKPWVVGKTNFGTSLRHPLVYMIPLTLPGEANKAYERKRAALERAEGESNWQLVIDLHERPYRLRALIEYVVGVDEETGEPIPLAELGKEARDLAAYVWTDSENINQHIEDWGCLFSGADRFILGDEEAYNRLPDRLTVYRAGIDDGGWSWTLNREVAEFFAHRFGGNEAIYKGVTEKEYVFGYLTSRQEEEVLVQRNKVWNVKKL